MSTYTYITETGVVVPDPAAIRDEVIAEWRTAFGQDFDVDPATPQGALITSQISERLSVAQNLAALANQINPDLAGGVFLLSLCALLGIVPPAATATRVTATLGGTPLNTLPAGLLARTGAGDVFVSQASVVLDAAGAGSVLFVAQELGPIPCAAGALSNVVTAQLGWETVTNPTDGLLGQGALSDAEIRALRRNSLAAQGRGFAEALLAAVAAVAGVSAVRMLQNAAASTLTLGTITLAPYSIWVCAQGGADGAVATAMLAASNGQIYNGQTLVQVTEPSSGQVIPVRFDRPVAVAVAVRVTMRLPVGSLATAQTVVDAVLAWASGTSTLDAGLQIGLDVSPFEIAAAVGAAIQGFIAKVEVAAGATQPYSWQTTDFSVNTNGLPTIANNQIFAVFL